MADLRYTVDVDTRGAQSALAGLTSSLAGIGAAVGSAFSLREVALISARFEDLRTTLGILYKDTETGAKAFEQIKEFATQSVFSVEDLTASVVKLKAAGLEPSIQQLRLFADVASVSADSVGALQAITDLYARTTAGGLGLEDLNRLADRGIPVFTILEEKIGKNRLELSKFGQSAEGAQIILAALEEGLQESFGGASQQRLGNLSQSMSNFGDAMSNVADLIGEGGFNDALTEAINSLSEFIEKNQELIRNIGEGLGIAIRFAADNVKYLIAIMGGFFAAKTAGLILSIAAAVFEFAKGLRQAATAGAVLQGVTGVGLVKLAAGVAAAAGIVESINALTTDTSNNVEDLQDRLDELANQPDTAPGPLSIPAPTLDTKPVTNYREQLQEIEDKQNDITRSTINYFAEYQDGVEKIRNAVRQEGELLKLSEDQANIQRELNKFTERYFATIRPLQREVTALRLKDTEESKVQADEIERQIGLITELYNSSISGLRQELELREQNRIADEKRILLAETQLKLQQDLQDLIRESDQDLADLNLNPFEKQLADINRAVDDKLVDAIRNLKGEWQDGLISGDEYIAEIAKLEASAQQAETKLRENAAKQREIQRSFQYGWKEAFENYVDDATNAAKSAERVFNKATKGMEDAIVNFVKTGKFEFKDLINTILEELLRSQIRQLIAQTFGSFGQGGGAGGLNDLFAGFFANGGTIPAGSFGVVGERGPELVSGPATVTPMTGASNVTYNIQAVDASSFKQLVARDPGFIHAVAMQGSKAVPTRR